MKAFFILFLTLISLTGTIVKSTGNELNGIWAPVKQEIGGTALPASSFGNQQLTIADSNYIFVAESTDKGIAKYADGKMDIYGKEGVNTGKHFTAIYKLESDTLSICYNLNGQGYPESFITKGKPFYFLCIFKKQERK